MRGNTNNCSFIFTVRAGLHVLLLRHPLLLERSIGELGVQRVVEVVLLVVVVIGSHPIEHRVVRSDRLLLEPLLRVGSGLHLLLSKHRLVLSVLYSHFLVVTLQISSSHYALHRSLSDVALRLVRSALLRNHLELVLREQVLV